jgi:GlcNAc-P-P-Und epimerase
MKTAVIFGGSGFIGLFYAKHLIDIENYNKVYIYDIQKVEDTSFKYRHKLINSYNNIVEIQGDVKKTISWVPDEKIDLIGNFAAIHREPGHSNNEYYDTNIPGARNVVDWAEKIGCKKIIFTSSIAPYGLSEATRDEESIPNPSSGYGGSKLVAEHIHKEWLATSKSDKQLIIVRPGVVFGPGEGGNMSRLIKAVKAGYFFYMGNKNTRKAGTYVKELCNAISWVDNFQQENNEKFSLFNMTMHPAPSVSEYVTAIKKISNTNKFQFTFPYFALLAVAYIIDIICKPLGLNQPFSPVRIKKLVRSNDIKPGFLLKHKYKYKYSLESSLRDWKTEYSKEWE